VFHVLSAEAWELERRAAIITSLSSQPAARAIVVNLETVSLFERCLMVGVGSRW
jgi:hypothetical protein